MLIIFDLDNTLIDSSASIIPVKLNDALHKMIESGLQISNIDIAYKEILALNETSKNGTEVITKFCDSKNQMELAKKGIEEYYHNIDASKIAIQLVDGAEEIIEALAEQHTLAIVTFGIEAQQLQKIKSAKLNRELFSKICVTPLEDKERYYQKLMDEHKVSAKETIVIGDNLKRDVIPAKEIGIHAIHFRYGRSKHIEYNENTQPSFSIKSLKEIVDVVNKLKQ